MSVILSLAFQKIKYLEDDERGEPNGGDKEWSFGRKAGHHDKSHDDDIEVLIKSNGNILIEYR